VFFCCSVLVAVVSILWRSPCDRALAPEFKGGRSIFAILCPVHTHISHAHVMCMCMFCLKKRH
jgi:hypothetical protein